MSFVLLWLELLAIGLLWVAAGSAWLARLHSRATSLILRGVFMLQVVLFWGAVAAAAIYVDLMVAYWVSLSIIAIGFSILISYCAIRRREGMPAGCRWRAWRLTGVFTAGLALHLTTLWALDSMARGKLEAAEKEALAKVLALAPPAVPDKDNACVIYAAANRLLPTDTDHIPVQTLTDWDLLRDQSIQWQDPLLADYLQKCAATIEAVQAASLKSRYVFSNNYSNPDWNLPAENLMTLRGLARLLALDARYQAQQDHLSATVKDLNALYALARHASQNPTVISLLIAGSIHEIALRTLESSLRFNPQLAREFDSLEIDPNFSYRQQSTWAFQTEALWELKSYREMVFNVDASYLIWLDLGNISHYERWKAARPILAPAALYYRVYFMFQDVAGFQRMPPLLLMLTAKPYWEISSRVDSTTQAMAEEMGIVSKDSLLSLKNMPRVLARSDVAHRLSLLLAAAARYRERHGNLPVDMATLAAENPGADFRDPFDGQPLRMIHKDNGLVLYSVGTDAEDDGGAVDGINDPDEGDYAVGLGTQPATVVTPPQPDDVPPDACNP